MSKHLKYVTSPGKIGSVEIRNRMVRMGAQFIPIDSDTDDGTLSPRYVQFYEDLAAGGLGLVTLAGSGVDLGVPDYISTVRFDDDFFIPSLTAAAERVHKHGAAVFWQLYTPGNLGASTLTREDMATRNPHGSCPRGLSVEEIDVLVGKYVEYALRFQKCGFDGVEINSAHSHGLNTFLSPAYNSRTDEYGGSIENRCRLLVRIIKGIKEACGKDFAIINLISAAELNIPNGITLEDSCRTAQILEEAGSDAIHVRYEMYLEGKPGMAVRHSREIPDIALWPEHLDGDLAEYKIDTSFGNGKAAWSGGAAEIKKGISVPVICSGRMDAVTLDGLIADGKVDFGNFCRRTAADNDYAKKVMEDRMEDIRPCVGCFTCYDMSERGLRAWCMVNPALTALREECAIEPAETKKKVLIVGAGAAGLEAARVSALRGHDVTVVDRESHLGGSLPLAALIKDFHEDFQGFSDWQVREIQKLGVKTQLKTNVDKAFVEAFKPDAIIIATGGAENIPDIPGINNKIVVTGEELHKQLRLATKAFSTKALGKLSKLWLPLGDSVILLGGGIHGVQTAKFLMERKRKVIILEESNELGAGMNDCGPKSNLLKWLDKHGCEMHKGVTIKEITDKGVVYVDACGNEQLAEASNVVTTMPLLNNLDLYEQVKDLAPQVYAVGDCNPLEFDEPYPQMVFLPVETVPQWPHFTATAVRDAFDKARRI